MIFMCCESVPSLTNLGSIPIVHIGRLSEHKINIILIVSLSCMGVPCPKELSSDVMPHPKETSTLNMLKAKQTYYNLTKCARHAKNAGHQYRISTLCNQGSALPPPPSPPLQDTNYHE